MWGKARHSDSESGLGLVLVIAMVSVVSILLLALPVILHNTLRQRTAHQVYNQDLDAAESGVNAVLGKLQSTHSYSFGPDVSAQVAMSGWSSSTAETSWARSNLTALAATAANRITTPTGEYVAIRPASLQTIYSIGYTPNYAHATRIRVLKADYSFTRKTGDSALLTGGDVQISGSVIISSGAPDGSAVHSNGNVYSNGSSSDVITGTISATGVNGFPGGTSQVPAHDIPTIDPRYLYTTQEPYYASAWYDLCPDGVIRRGSSSGVPCTGTAAGSLAAWSFASGTWSENGVGPDGIYYAYQSDVVVGTSGVTVNQTIISESTNNLACPKSNGSITMKKAFLNAYLPGVVLVAGNNLSTSSNTSATGGLVAAQDGISLTTSSAPGVVGNVIAADMCSGDANNVQGTTITYQAGSGFPAPGPVQVTREIELR